MIRLWTGCATVLLVALVGCGGPRTGTVSGKVTHKGKPPNLNGLTISFQGADGRPVTVSVGADGTYRVEDVPEGNVLVGFGLTSTAAQKAEEDEKPRPGESLDEFQRRLNDPKGNAGGAARTAKRPASAIPEAYLDPVKSGLKTTVSAGQNTTFDVDIK